MGCGELTSISPAPLLEAQRAHRPSPRKRQCIKMLRRQCWYWAIPPWSELIDMLAKMSPLAFDIIEYNWHVWLILVSQSMAKLYIVTVTRGKGNGIPGSSRSGHHSFKREATWRQPQRIWPSVCWWGIAAILVAAHGDLWLFVSWDYCLKFEFRGAYELMDTYVHWALQASWMHDCSKKKTTLK